MDPTPHALLLLGGFLLLGLLADTLARRTRLPRVTLLLLLGMLAGPHAFDVLPPERDVWFAAAAAIALVMVGGSYWFSDKLALKAGGAQVITREQAPEFYDMVARLAERAELPMPTVAVSPSPQPNAFATGRNPEHASIAITTGLLDQLDKPLLILHGKEDPRVHPSQSLAFYRYLKLRDQAPVRLILSPGEGHGNRRAAARLDYTLRQLRWFDRWLKDEPNGVDEEAPVKIFVQGANRWRDETDWPLARAVDTPWYLDADGVPNTWPWTARRFHKEMRRPRLDDYELRTA